VKVSQSRGLNIDLSRILVVVKGGGDLGTGVAHRLHRVGMRVVVTELPRPHVIRRMVAFASAIYEGEIVVDGVKARRASSCEEARLLLRENVVPVVADPEARAVEELRPHVLVDATMAKRNIGTSMEDAPIVIGLGPGFVAGVDVHAVVETMRGHDLGRVIMRGSALPDTGVPGPILGYAEERVLRAPRAGRFRGLLCIGDRVETGQVVAEVEGEPICAEISGVLRGLLYDGLPVREGQKVGDVDPRGVRENCFTISDKARAVGGGVLEAILWLARPKV